MSWSLGHLRHGPRTCNYRSDIGAKGASAQETKTPDTEGCGESRGERGSRQQWKQWRGCRRAQGAEGWTALPGVMLKQVLRNEQDTQALCGVVYDTYTVPDS